MSIENDSREFLVGFSGESFSFLVGFEEACLSFEAGNLFLE